MTDKYGNPWPQYRVYKIPKGYRPLRAVRLKCLDCCCAIPAEVELCPARDCPLWPYRFGKYPPGAKRTVLKPIRQKCLDCAPEPGKGIGVKQCPKKCCPLWIYRFGKNPKRKGHGRPDIAVLGEDK